MQALSDTFPTINARQVKSHQTTNQRQPTPNKTHNTPNLRTFHTDILVFLITPFWLHRFDYIVLIAIFLITPLQPAGSN